MKILEKLLEKLSNKIKNRNSPKVPGWLVASFFAGSFLGFLDSTYLTIEHYSGASLRCFLIQGCDNVLASSFSEIMRLPVALLGAVYYLIIFILVIAYIDTAKKIFMNIISRLTVAGFIMSLWFLLVQFFIIKAVCTYCLVSAFISITLFVFGLFLLKILESESHWEKFIGIMKKLTGFISR